MDELKRILSSKIQLAGKNCQASLSAEALERLYSVYPFNRFEYVISNLIAERIITIDEYNDIRSSYMNRNKYLYLFEITAPRTFGETWAQRHLGEIVPELQRPTKAIDPNYNGEYDFWYNGIRIEVKASRAVRKRNGGTLVDKALSFADGLQFDMNFQQIKTHCCDVFVWIGVWKDRIVYWVLSSGEVEKNPYFSKGQRRGNKGIEGQLWIKNTNIGYFEPYRVEVNEVLNKINEKSR